MLKGVSISRVQSPSSINTYKQCPRKYFYRYVLKLPSQPSIHLTRGKITHSVLEDFFALEVNTLSDDNFLFELHILLQEMFKRYWKDNLHELKNLDMTVSQLDFYKQETHKMLENWFSAFTDKLKKQSQKMNVLDAFNVLKPKTEVRYFDEGFGIQGYIDAIHEYDSQTILLDYKTSKRNHISDEYYLQLAIYAFLYKLKHNQLPDKVGIHFLKHNEVFLDVDETLVSHAQDEIELIHINTESKNMADYPKKPSPLCKWSTGQCDFYDICFKQRTLDKF